jgi:hypothetical protein
MSWGECKGGFYSWGLGGRSVASKKEIDVAGIPKKYPLQIERGLTAKFRSNYKIIKNS